MKTAPFPLPDFNTAVPVTVSLPAPETGKLVCEEAVRVFPGRRAVWRATLDGAPVFAKLFQGAAGRREWRHERDGAIRLLHEGVQAPPMRYAGCWDSHHCALVYEAIENAQTLRDALARPDADRDRLLRQAVTVLAQHHEAGLQQTDMHLRNFLLAGDGLYTLDAGDIKPLSLFFGHGQAWRNLAAFLSLLSVDDDARLPDLVACYRRLRSDGPGPATDTLVRRTRRERRRRQRRYLAKMYRSSSQHVARRRWRRFAVWRREYDGGACRLLFEQPDRAFDEPAEWLKRGHTCSVVRSTEPAALVIKRYNIKSVLHALSRAFRPTRASVSWRAAHHLLSLGVATPKPVALIESRWGPLRGTAWLLMEQVHGPNSRDWLADASRTDADRRRHLQEVLEMCLRLYRARLSHGDMKLSNVLVSEGRPVLIDLDAMQWHRGQAAFEKAFGRDMQRLLRNFDNQPGLAALLRQLAAGTELARFFP